jgi:hypothetical protein
MYYTNEINGATAALMLHEGNAKIEVLAAGKVIKTLYAKEGSGRLTEYKHFLFDQGFRYSHRGQLRPI